MIYIDMNDIENKKYHDTHTLLVSAKKCVILVVDTHPNGIKKNDTGPTLIAIAQSNTKA
jgi:hypothetical protein